MQNVVSTKCMLSPCMQGLHQRPSPGTTGTQTYTKHEGDGAVYSYANVTSNSILQLGTHRFFGYNFRGVYLTIAPEYSRKRNEGYVIDMNAHRARFAQALEEAEDNVYAGVNFQAPRPKIGPNNSRIVGCVGTYNGVKSNGYRGLSAKERVRRMKQECFREMKNNDGQSGSNR